MHVIIDIPEQAYQEFEAQASAEKTSVNEIMADRLRKAAGLPMSASRMINRYPLIESAHPDSIDPAMIAEFDFFDPS